MTGGYHYDRRLIEGLRALGWTVTVRLLDGSFPFPTREALDGAREVFASLGDDALVVIDGLALGAMPEVVESHARRLKMVALVHHPLALESGLPADVAGRLRRSEEAALRSVRHVIVTSERTREALLAYGVAPSRVSVVEPGTEKGIGRGHLAGRVSGKEGVPERRSLSEAVESALERGLLQRGAAGLATNRDAGARELLCVATVIPRKGHDVLIEALAGLRGLAWHLTCVGSLERSPETAARLRQQINAAGLGERVRLAGELEVAELERCFAGADLFVFPSRYEGFGMAVAEALAHGLPVVATRTGAIPALVMEGPDEPVFDKEHLQSGSAARRRHEAARGTSLPGAPPQQDWQAGIVVPPGDAVALREALSRLLTEPGLLDACRQGAREAGARLAAWPQVCDKAARVLTQVAAL